MIIYNNHQHLPILHLQLQQKQEIEQILEELNNIPEGWAACYLGRNNRRNSLFDEDEKVSENLVVPIACKTGYSYLVSLNGAEKLSQEDFPQNLYNISDYLTYTLENTGDSETPKLIYSTD